MKTIDNREVHQLQISFARNEEVIITGRLWVNFLHTVPFSASLKWNSEGLLINVEPGWPDGIESALALDLSTASPSFLAELDTAQLLSRFHSSVDKAVSESKRETLAAAKKRIKAKKIAKFTPPAPKEPDCLSPEAVAASIDPDALVFMFHQFEHICPAQKKTIRARSPIGQNYIFLRYPIKDKPETFEYIPTSCPERYRHLPKHSNVQTIKHTYCPSCLGYTEEEN